MAITANTRILAFPLTGVQRYLLELLPRLREEGPVATLQPRHARAGAAGHAWEQLVLPRKLQGSLLWSPSNVGPLRYARQVVTIHDAVPLDHPEWLNPRFAAWYRFLLPRLMQRVRRVIAISAFTRDRLQRLTGLPDSKFVVVPHGLSERFQPQAPEAISAARAALGLPGPRYVLSLGSLEPRKNLGRLLEAWRQAQARVPDDIWLVVAGGRGERRVFAQLQLSPPARTYFAGPVPDSQLPALYSGALAFAYPSLYEGFGWPPLEAMGCGTATVTSAVTAMPEVVGDAAITIDPLDVAAIADALTQLCNNETLRAELARQGRVRAAQFSWDRAARATWQAFMAAAN